MFKTLAIVTATFVGTMYVQHKVSDVLSSIPQVAIPRSSVEGENNGENNYVVVRQPTLPEMPEIPIWPIKIFTFSSGAMLLMKAAAHTISVLSISNGPDEVEWESMKKPFYCAFGGMTLIGTFFHFLG